MSLPHTFFIGGAKPPLFNFTSHTFTTAGAYGHSGPTTAQLQSAYSATDWAQNTNFLVSNQGIQTFTVPKTGLYRITAKGSAGGQAIGLDSDSSRNGYGYNVQGVFELIRGEYIYIIAGQNVNVNRTGNQASGGGGGSWVWKNALSGASAIPLIVGAGGNGESWENHTSNDPDGQAVGASFVSNWFDIVDGRATTGASWDRNGTGGSLGAVRIIDGGRGAGATSIPTITSPNISLSASTAPGGFGGGGAANPYEGGGGGGWTGGVPKATNAYSAGYNPGRGATSYVNQALATTWQNLGLGGQNYGSVVLERL